MTAAARLFGVLVILLLSMPSLPTAGAQASIPTLQAARDGSTVVVDVRAADAFSGSVLLRHVDALHGTMVDGFATITLAANQNATLRFAGARPDVAIDVRLVPQGQSPATLSGSSLYDGSSADGLTILAQASAPASLGQEAWRAVSHAARTGVAFGGQVVATPGGALVIADLNATGVHAYVSLDGGRTWSPPVDIAADTNYDITWGMATTGNLVTFLAHSGRYTNATQPWKFVQLDPATRIAQVAWTTATTAQMYDDPGHASAVVRPDGVGLVATRSLNGAGIHVWRLPQGGAGTLLASLTLDDPSSVMLAARGDSLVITTVNSTGHLVTLRSTDGGTTWTAPASIPALDAFGLTYPIMYALAVDAQDTTHFIVMGDESTHRSTLYVRQSVGQAASAVRISTINGGESGLAVDGPRVWLATLKEDLAWHLLASTDSGVHFADRALVVTTESGASASAGAALGLAADGRPISVGAVLDAAGNSGFGVVPLADPLLAPTIRIMNIQNDANLGRDAGETSNLATDIGAGSYTGQLAYSDGDKGDWYRIQPPSGQRVVVTFHATSGALYGGEYTDAGADITSGVRSDGQTITFAPQAGPIRLGFGDNAGAGTAAYAFTVAYQPVAPAQNDANIGSDAPESSGGAVNIGAGSYSGELRYDAGDKGDWFRVTPPAGQDVVVTFRATGGGLYGGEYTDAGADITTGVRSDGSTVTFNPRAGPLRLGFGDNAGVGTATYAFTVTFQPHGDPVPPQNDAGLGRDAGETSNLATDIGAGSYSGELRYDAGDKGDWYRIAANPSAKIVVTFRATSGGLYGGEYTDAGADITAGVRSDGQNISFAPLDGPIRIGFGDNLGSGSATYSFTVSYQQAPTPPPAPTPTTTPAAPTSAPPGATPTPAPTAAPTPPTDAQPTPTPTTTQPAPTQSTPTPPTPEPAVLLHADDPVRVPRGGSARVAITFENRADDFRGALTPELSGLPANVTATLVTRPPIVTGVQAPGDWSLVDGHQFVRFDFEIAAGPNASLGESIVHVEGRYQTDRPVATTSFRLQVVEQTATTPLPVPGPGLGAIALVAGIAALLAAAWAALRTDWVKLLAGGAVAAMYTRHKKADVLKHEVRAGIYRHIRETPGARYEEIRKSLGLPNGVLAFHLRVLQREGFVRTRTQWTRKRYWATDAPGAPAADTRAHDAVARLLAGGGLSPSAVAGQLGISRQLARYHLKALEREGRVTAVGAGAAMRYTLLR